MTTTSYKSVLMSRGQGGRQPQFSDYDPALRTGPGLRHHVFAARRSPFLVPTSFRSPLLTFALAAIVFGYGVARLPVDAAAAVTRTTPRGTFRQRSHPETDRRRTRGGQSPSEPSACRTDGAARHPAAGFDCSGLVYWAYARLGIERSTQLVRAP